MDGIDAQKVVIYVTGPRGLLVFDEPDHPEVPLQVPGGTVEPGETVLAAARRELHEETGLSADAPFASLGVGIYTFERGGRIFRHQRAWFHAVAKEAPAEWIHVERTPDGGGPPIRFRLHWVALSVAAERLGFGFGEMISALEARDRGDRALSPAVD